MGHLHGVVTADLEDRCAEMHARAERCHRRCVHERIESGVSAVQDIWDSDGVEASFHDVPHRFGDDISHR